MRQREKIEKQASEFLIRISGEGDKRMEILTLEVLLDIRDLLEHIDDNVDYLAKKAEE